MATEAGSSGTSAAFWAEQMMDLPPVPTPAPGTRTGPPDFVGVGAQKSGTSLWYRLLTTHPAVAPAARKEIHFFDRLLAVEEPDLRAYELYFPRGPGQICGEWTPRYMVDPWTPPLLAAAAPEAKLLVLLRDPVERFASSLDYNRFLATRSTPLASQIGRASCRERV